jgi:hypothetical protein
MRPLGRLLALVVPLGISVVLAGACAESKRALGEDCLKDQDCLSGVCEQLKCGAVPEFTDAMAQSDATATSDASGDAAASGDSAAEAAPDAAPDVVDSGTGGG